MTLPDKTYIQINQALFSLAHAYETRMAADQLAEQSGMTMADCSTVMVIGQFEPLNARRLSELMEINPGTISVYIQRLVEKSLVRRERDVKDRRNWWLRLTEAGEMAYALILEGTVEYTREFLAGLDKDEQAELHRLLLKASHGLGYDWQ